MQFPAIHYVHVSVWFPVLYTYSILYTHMLCACVAYCVVPYTLYIYWSDVLSLTLWEEERDRLGLEKKQSFVGLRCGNGWWVE